MADPMTRLLPQLVRSARRHLARMPQLSMGRVPDAPALPIRDLWPGDPARGAGLLRGELSLGGGTVALRAGGFAEAQGPTPLRAYLHGFTWLRDLRALGTDGARSRARSLVAEWGGAPSGEPLATRPDVTGARIAAWLGHYDFFAASADDAFRQRLMTRLVSDARTLAAALPTEELDGRALTAIKGLVAAAVALPEQTGFLTRAMRVLPGEIGRQVLADGSHLERSPAMLLAALQDLTEIRALLQAANVTAPPSLAAAIERMGPALRALRHGDGGLALFNGTRGPESALVELALAQAGRAGRAATTLADGGFERLLAGRTLVIVDTGVPAAPKHDRVAHAGTLSMEISVGRERLIGNVGDTWAAAPQWRDAVRATAAHSTLVLADTSSSELKPDGLGRRPAHVEISRQEANGAHWLEVSHDGWRKPFGAVHRRRLYMAESGEDIRGEDVIEAAEPQPFTIRFHLHPDVDASVQHDHEAVLLRLPSGSGWRLRAEGARIDIEESLWLGTETPRKAEQVVLTGFQDGPQHVKWAITKVG